MTADSVFSILDKSRSKSQSVRRQLIASGKEPVQRYILFLILLK